MADGARPNYPLMMIQAEIASGKATVRSLGALYMVAMASVCIGAEPEGYWSAINGAIGDHLGGETLAVRVMKLDRVKEIGWTLYDAVCLLQAQAVTA